MGKIQFSNLTKPALDIVESLVQDTPDADVPLSPGPVRIVKANGRITRAKADTALNARFYGLIVKKVNGFCPATVIRKGVVTGYNLTALSFDDIVYLDNDGDLSTTPGTVSVPVGRIIALKGQLPGQPFNKALSVEF